MSPIYPKGTHLDKQRLISNWVCSEVTVISNWLLLEKPGYYKGDTRKSPSPLNGLRRHFKENTVPEA